jgi:hypothetical protein
MMDVQGPTLSGAGGITGGGSGDADMKEEPSEQARKEQVHNIGKYCDFKSMRAPNQKFNQAALGNKAVSADMLESNMDEESRGVTVMHDILIEMGLHDAPTAVEEPVTIFTTSREQAQKLNMEKLSDVQLEEYMDTATGAEEALQDIRLKRIKELQDKRKAQKHGSVYDLDIKQFNEEVTIASFEGFVVMLIYIHNSEACDVLRHALAKVADKHRAVKFVQVIASRAIEGFLERDCPCILTYRSGIKISQYNTLSAFNKFKTDADCVEWVLAEDEVLETTLRGDPRLHKSRAAEHTHAYTSQASNNIIRTLAPDAGKYELDSDDFDSDLDV